MLRVVGNFSAVLYRLENAGDELPLHDHDFEHSSIVLEGAVEAFDNFGKAVRLSKGESIVFPAGRKHGIRAVTTDAAFLNLMPILDRVQSNLQDDKVSN